MVTRLLLIACIISALPLKIHARLGWTLQECRDHYGKETFISEVPPAGPIFQDFHFQVGHFFVGVNFMNNRVGQRRKRNGDIVRIGDRERVRIEGGGIATGHRGRLQRGGENPG